MSKPKPASKQRAGGFDVPECFPKPARNLGMPEKNAAACAQKQACRVCRGALSFHVVGDAGEITVDAWSARGNVVRRPTRSRSVVPVALSPPLPHGRLCCFFSIPFDSRP